MFKKIFFFIILFFSLESCSSDNNKNPKSSRFIKSDYAIKIESKSDRLKYKGDTSYTRKYKKQKFVQSGNATKKELEKIIEKSGNHK